MASRKINLNGFKCECCGHCCSLSGYVFLENGEAEKIAHFLGVDVYEFTERFTMLAPGRTRLSLTEQSNGHCVFLEKNNTCRIQPVKPIQCTGFPYTWSSHDLLDGCEGMRRMKERDLAETQR